MKKTILLVLLLALIVLVVAACSGGNEQSAPSGDPDVAAGKALFEKTILGTSPGCVTCHSTEPGKTIVGPSLAGIGNQSEEFLRESILDPDADITEGFPAGTMPKTYKDDLTEEEVNQLVKYLMTLK